eukprot:1160893-Pelagomonas_calceolata.AAC.2
MGVLLRRLAEDNTPKPYNSNSKSCDRDAGKELQGAASGGAAEVACRGVGGEGVRGRSRGPGQATRPGWASHSTIALSGEPAYLACKQAARSHHRFEPANPVWEVTGTGNPGSAVAGKSEVVDYEGTLTVL